MSVRWRVRLMRRSIAIALESHWLKLMLECEVGRAVRRFHWSINDGRIEHLCAIAVCVCVRSLALGFRKQREKSYRVKIPAVVRKCEAEACFRVHEVATPC